MNAERHEVFISYSSKDSNVANHLVNLLESKGIKCWLAERDIPAGTPNWEQPITEAIHSAKIFVVIISNNSVNSTQVPREVRLAVNFCEAIYPIRIDNVQLKGSFEYYLSGYQWTDITSEQREKLEKFSNTLQRYLHEGSDSQNRIASSDEISNTLSNGNATKAVSKKFAYIAIAIAAVIAIGGILFGVLKRNNSKQIESADTALSASEVNNDAVNASDDVSDTVDELDDEESPNSQHVLNVPASIPTQSRDMEDIYSELITIYEEMFESETQPVDMTNYLPNLVNTDIDNDGIDDEFLFTKTETEASGYYNGNIDIVLSSGSRLSFNDADDTETNENSYFCPISTMMPVDVCAVDIDKDGICEVLFKQAFGSTGGVLCEGYLFDFSDGEWNVLHFDDYRHNTTKVIDLELSEDGILVLLNSGAKDGPFQYMDYMGVKCILNGSYIREVEKNKAIGKEYWPLEFWSMDPSNYEEHDFTVTDEAIVQLKEKLEIPSDARVSIEVSSVLYYERRDVYLKQIIFQGDGIYDYVYVDKYNNIIDFNMY